MLEPNQIFSDQINAEIKEYKRHFKFFKTQLGNPSANLKNQIQALQNCTGNLTKIKSLILGNLTFIKEYSTPFNRAVSDLEMKAKALQEQMSENPSINQLITSLQKAKLLPIPESVKKGSTTVVPPNPPENESSKTIKLKYASYAFFGASAVTNLAGGSAVGFALKKAADKVGQEGAKLAGKELVKEVVKVAAKDTVAKVGVASLGVGAGTGGVLLYKSSTKKSC